MPVLHFDLQGLTFQASRLHPCTISAPLLPHPNPISAPFHRYPTPPQLPSHLIPTPSRISSHLTPTLSQIPSHSHPIPSQFPSLPHLLGCEDAVIGTPQGLPECSTIRTTGNFSFVTLRCLVENFHDKVDMVAHTCNPSP